MGGGGGEASIRHGAFIRGEGASYTNFVPQGGHLLDTRRLFESGHLLGRLRYLQSTVGQAANGSKFGCLLF